MDKNTHHRIVTLYQQAANSYIIGYKVKRQKTLFSFEKALY